MCFLLGFAKKREVDAGEIEEAVVWVIIKSILLCSTPTWTAILISLPERERDTERERDDYYSNFLLGLYSNTPGVYKSLGNM